MSPTYSFLLWWFFWKNEEITGKIEAFSADEYDYSVAKTQKLFHYCLLFKPGVYEVSYCVLDDNGTPIDIFSATKKQIITIGEDCNGCLGCLGCDGCAGCRDKYIPDSIRELELKRILSDWLLVGLCALGMMCWSAFQHHWSSAGNSRKTKRIRA